MAPVRLAARSLQFLRRFRAAAGLFLTVGFALAILILFALSELIDAVLEQETLRFDEAVLLWMDARSSPWLDTVAVQITSIGNTLVIGAICLISASLLHLLGKTPQAKLLCYAVAGAAIVNPALKALFARPRPQLFEWGVDAGSHSFPSGHTTMATVVFTIIIYIVHQLTERRATELLAVFVGAVIVVLIGLSRIYLGVHYPSDVMAGFAIGFVWAMGCALGAELLRHPSAHTAETEAKRSIVVAGETPRLTGLQREDK